MGIDIRFPLGLMFAIVGVLLWAYGWLGDKSIYARSLGMNVNLVWGAVLFFFGATMLLLAWHAKTARRPQGPSERDQRAGKH
jgi:drug/metabolite transporter (DMT)-like permease